MSEEGLSLAVMIAQIIASLASTAVAVQQATKGGPKPPGAPGVSRADLAARGLMRPEAGATSAAFSAGLRGAPPNPQDRGGSATDKPLGAGMDEFSNVLQQFGGGASGGVGATAGASMGGGGLSMGNESMDIG